MPLAADASLEYIKSDNNKSGQLIGEERVIISKLCYTDEEYVSFPKINLENVGTTPYSSGSEIANGNIDAIFTDVNKNFIVCGIKIFNSDKLLGKILKSIISKFEDPVYFGSFNSTQESFGKEWQSLKKQKTNK